jgi:N utilization substance protein B
MPLSTDNGAAKVLEYCTIWQNRENLAEQWPKRLISHTSCQERPLPYMPFFHTLNTAAAGLTTIFAPEQALSGMISRRNIRVKVMQTIYAVENTSPMFNQSQALSILEKHLEQSRQLFTYLVYFVTEVARYAEIDARQKASKHLPTAEDLNVNIKIAGNSLVWQILEDKEYQQSVKEHRIESIIDTEMVRKTYLRLTDTPEYKTYASIPSRDKKDEKKILEFIFSALMLPDDNFISHVEELFISWDDDAEMMNLMMLNFLQKPATYHFQELVSKEKLEFARKLVSTVMDKKDYCMELIVPKLKNWDAERIAVLDMILMRMGTCEFLYFETIPAKVTLNEYIDLAKDYSTPQSGHFVNGILDNIHKELSLADKLRKVDYKKQ